MSFSYNTNFTKQIRDDLGMSVNDMLKIVGWTSKTLQQWESGQRLPSINAIAKLCRHYFSEFTEIPLLVEGDINLTLSGKIVNDTTFSYCKDFSRAVQGESSREELSSLLKVSSTAIYAWQQGKLPPSLTRVEAMATLHFSRKDYSLPLISRGDYSPLWLG